MKQDKKNSEKAKKRTQRDYTLGFKLSVVDLVEKGDLTYKQAQRRYGIQGRSTVLTWLRKHGRLDWSQPYIHFKKMPNSEETPAQKIKRLEKELADEKARNLVLNRMIDISDKEFGTAIRKKPLARTARELQQERKLSLAHACRLFGISRQTIYQHEKAWLERESDLLLVKQLVENKRRLMPRLGTRKLYALLKADFVENGVKIGRDGLFDYLRRERMLVKPKKNYTKTTHSKHWLRKHPNLYQNRKLSRPEEVFVSDITYIKTDQGTHYLSLVTDAYSRKIVGHHLSNDMNAESVVKALKKAFKSRKTTKDLIHHSDRGLQYCSEIYQRELKNNRVTPSMTEGYDCYQNALAERVNGILKGEFLIHQCKTVEELERYLSESINTYNNIRPHLSLNMKTPNQIHEKTTEEYPVVLN
ncbi:IS3 family transposase [Fulvivirga ligni]|nr:IS3 family transposase [Fulvivirga ligni]UII23490.1 IS3 family transposase [Fulvivirga ligni]